MISQLRAVIALNAINGWIPVYRRPIALLAVISTPFSFLFFIYIFGGPSKILIGAIGGLLFTIVNSATMLQTDLLFYKLDLKFQQIVASTPVSPLLYTFGLATGNIIFTLPGIAIFFVIIIYFSHITAAAVLVIIGTLFATWAIFSMFSYLVSTRIREMRDIWPISVMFSILFGVVPPIYYSIYSLPLALQYVAYVVPTSWAALLMKGAIAGNFSGIAIYALIYFVEMVGVIFVTSRLANWKKNRI